MRDILVGVDLEHSSTARTAVEAAAELATAMGRPLRLVCGVPQKQGEAGHVSAGGEQWFVDNLAAIEGRLQDLARELGLKECTCSALIGDPAGALVDEATRRDASMVVVGNRRAQGWARVLGSVAADVVRDAPCHVLVAYTT